jgi:hypothetical protein
LVARLIQADRCVKALAAISTTTNQLLATPITPVPTSSPVRAASTVASSVPLASVAQAVAPIATAPAPSNLACRRPRHWNTNASTQKALAIATPALKRASSNGLSPAPPSEKRTTPQLKPTPVPRIAPGPMMRRWPSARSCATSAQATAPVAIMSAAASTSGSNAVSAGQAPLANGAAQTADPKGIAARTRA